MPLKPYESERFSGFRAFFACGRGKEREGKNRCRKNYLLWGNSGLRRVVDQIAVAVEPGAWQGSPSSAQWGSRTARSPGGGQRAKTCGAALLVPVAGVFSKADPDNLSLAGVGRRLGEGQVEETLWSGFGAFGHVGEQLRSGGAGENFGAEQAGVGVSRPQIWSAMIRADSMLEVIPHFFVPGATYQ